MVKYGFKDEHHKNTCLKDIGIHAQNVLAIIGLIMNMIGGSLYDHHVKKEK